jgi:hypothetical protein
MNQNQKAQMVADLERRLQPLMLNDKIEVLGQIMIGLGVRQILRDYPELIPDRPLEPAEVIDLVLKDKRTGESLGGALAHQGLLMLMWLNVGVSNDRDFDNGRQA